MSLEFDSDVFGAEGDEMQRIAAERKARREALAANTPTGVDRAGGALQSGLAGAATGAKIGSAVPGIGTAIGAVAGGALGALGGALTAQPKQKVDMAGMAGSAASLAGQKWGAAPDVPVAREAFGAGIKAYKAPTLGGRMGVKSEMGDFETDKWWEPDTTEMA
mgnify:CR=1 FL=1